MFKRILGSFVAILVYGWINTILSPVLAVVNADTAGKQFDGSNASYMQAVWTFGFTSLVGQLLTLGLLLVLLLIWWKSLKELVSHLMVPALVLIASAAGMLSLSSEKSYAFFNSTDKTEFFPVKPNWSAFWIPGQGDVKNNQAQLNSEDFLFKNKVPALYFQVPHHKLAGSAGNSVFSGWDYYVPDGFLILVDRTPFTHEWVDATDRGSSSRKEGFPCQSKEGLNITAGVSIGAEVSEVNAAKFLYNFGVVSEGDDQLTGDPVADGPKIFKSVHYGRSLQNVMDATGRRMIQTLVCNEIGKRTFDQANAEQNEIMAAVDKDATDYFTKVGITITFIGWGDTFNFDKEVQDAVNRKYIAIQDEDISKRLEPHADILKVIAMSQAIRAFGDKSDGKLPQTYVGLTPDLLAIFGQITGSKSGASVPAAVVPLK